MRTSHDRPPDWAYMEWYVPPEYQGRSIRQAWSKGAKDRCIYCRISCNGIVRSYHKFNPGDLLEPFEPWRQEPRFGDGPMPYHDPNLGVIRDDDSK